MSGSDADTSGPGGDQNPAKQPPCGHDAALADYYEGLLPEAEAKDLEAHLEACEACQAAYRELENTARALSELSRRPAPEAFPKGVAETIRRRSGGRFFGRRALGDRIPVELLAIAALLVALAVYGWLRASETGSLAPPGENGDDAPASTEP